ncbi:MAG: sensor histidine kinase [Thaumarchaeota archaeon]|nr:sensor histidine kinase [Nitrososphaerota archaeon]
MQKKILIGFITIIAISVPNGIVSFLEVENTLTEIDSHAKTSIEDVKMMSRLDNSVTLMRYYDEVLTQAARNYAFTSDQKWLDVYSQTQPKLHTIISEACSSSPKNEKILFDKIAEINTTLENLEAKSLELTKQGKPSEAIALLDSTDYQNAKNAYSETLMQYSKQSEQDFDRADDMSTGEINQLLDEIKTLLSETQVLLYIGILVLLVIGVALGYFISRSISRPIDALNKAADRVSKGDYDVQFQTKTNDEIGQLGQKLQAMVISFKNSLQIERDLIVAQEKLKAEKLRAIGELSARIAHDLRNPLSVIKNVSDLIKLQYPTSDQKLKDHFAKMDTSIQRISHQIDDVLDFVRTTPLEKRISSLKEIITSSISDMEIPKGIKIELPQNDEKIDCDDVKLRTVFSNLILNAIQAMEGEGTVSVKITGYTKHVVIEVIDSGPGIPDNLLDKIFEPLFTTKQQGTGLGLPSCKNIIEQHGGTISAKNKPTTFTMSLPRI